VSTITTVTCTPLRLPLHTPFVTALRRTGATETLIVRVTDSDGVVGWGEAPQVWQVTGESVAGATACVEQLLAPLLLGRDVDDWEQVLVSVRGAVARNFGPRAALDVALHDLLARRAGIDLASFVAGKPVDPARLTLSTDVTLSAGAVDELAAVARARIEDGFTMLKMKVGTDASTDVARVRAVREAVGPAAALRLDANQGWTPREAVEVIRALADAALGVELVEQPVAGDDIEGLAWVTARVEIPVMADESVYGMRDLERIIRLGAADLVNIKLAKCGGLGAGRALLETAAQHGLGTIVGSMMEGPIGVGAAASLVAACPTSAVSDLDAAWWAADSPFVGGLRYERGSLVLPRSPGLGVHDLV